MPEIDLKTTKRTPKWLIIFCLILAGEMIFSLPFHVPRFFRPTLLEVLNMTNAEFGDAFVLYGIMAMLSYFPGGMIADRISPRKLITFSLIATALGGFFFAMIPGQLGLAFIFGFWGVTTVFLLWAAMIRATREWGGKLAQGRAFGLLDGGRGLVSAGAASLAVFVLATVLPDDLDSITPEKRMQAMQSVIYFYSLATLGAAILTWFFIPDSQLEPTISKKSVFSGIKYVIRSRSVWLQAIIVVCAYCGYKGLDFYTVYAVDILGTDEVSAARFMSYATYLRPVAAIGGGFLADRFTTKRVIGITFTLVMLSYIILALITPDVKYLNIIYTNLILTFIAVYALRGVYFALLEETNVRGSSTGTAVGLISVIGFTPDVFFYSAGGRIIDAAPGLSGFHNYFMFLGVFAFAGLLATLVLIYKKRQPA
jgi:nitrate/nitrite transporter NarK